MESIGRKKTGESRNANRKTEEDEAFEGSDHQ